MREDGLTGTTGPGKVVEVFMSDTTESRRRTRWVRLACNALLCGAVLAVAGTTEAAAQVPATGGITGMVYDSTRAMPLAGAEVFLIGTGTSTVTNNEGRFYIPGLQPGTYAITFRHARLELLGWVSEGVAVEVNAGIVADVQLTVPRSPRRQAEPIVPEMAAFREREQPVPVQGSPAVIVGTVVDATSGRGITGATVRVRDTNIGIITDDRGKFVLFGVPPGGHFVDVEMLGYASRSTPAAAVAGATFQIEIPLSTEAIELDPVVVEVRSGLLDRVGFYDRLDDPGSIGHFITPIEIERRAATNFAELFTNVPGARLNYGGPGRTQVLFRRMVGGADGTDGCQPELFVDGLRIRTANWSFLVPAWIAGIEIYVGSNIPIQYAINSCGVVLVWTKRNG